MSRGVLFDYGNRWGGASPPEDVYSHVSNLQRFARLHHVANALIEWLQTSFDVAVDHDPGVAADLLHQPDAFARAVRIVPSDPKAAALAFVLTDFPGVYLHAGSLHEFLFPACGCDACDDDVLNLAQELERTVRTVVSGGFSERFDPGRGDWIECRLDEPGVGMRSERSRTEDLPAGRVESARIVLTPSGRWSAWPLLPIRAADAIG